MRIVFRTDASAKIGSGHVMRCLALAEELEKNGSDISFISRGHEGNLNHLVLKRGFQVLEVNQPELEKVHGNMESFLTGQKQAANAIIEEIFSHD